MDCIKKGRDTVAQGQHRICISGTKGIPLPRVVIRYSQRLYVVVLKIQNRLINCILFDRFPIFHNAPDLEGVVIRAIIDA